MLNKVALLQGKYSYDKEKKQNTNDTSSTNTTNTNTNNNRGIRFKNFCKIHSSNRTEIMNTQ